MKIKTEEENFWGKISTFIVDKRNAFFLFFYRANNIQCLFLKLGGGK